MVQMVREGAETGYLPNGRDFMKEFEVSRRTVARDLDFLRDEERAPLALPVCGNRQEQQRRAHTHSRRPKRRVYTRRRSGAASRV